MNRMMLSLMGLAIFFAPISVHAHFVWLVPVEEDGQSHVCVYFGEDAYDNSSEFLSRVNNVVVKHVVGAEAAKSVQLTRTSERISAPQKTNGLYIATHDLGVMSRGDATFRLMYYAKTGPPITANDWGSCEAADDLVLDVTPELQGSKILTTVRFHGKPMAGVELTVARPGADDFTGTTDDQGTVTFDLADAGCYSLRAKHVESVPGEFQGKSFPETRHYSTVSLQIPFTSQPAGQIAKQLQPLPQPVTSFGAAVLENSVYLYGGHTGSAHSYSSQEQGNRLMQLSLSTGEWTALAEGPGLQGLALVAHGGKLYRIGGFSAMNDEGEEHDLRSQNDVACFDPKQGAWAELPALPEPRSSHDAAVVGDSLYVVGGWSMQGEGQTHWHTTAWKLNLTQQPLKWQAIAAPPFQRRALAAAAHQGRLYAIGGMQEEGGPTTATSVYDPATDSWADGPSLVVLEDKTARDASDTAEGSGRRNMSGGMMTGFGASAFATGGHLYVTTVQATLQKLSDDGSQWDVIATTPTGRFFHRLLPLDDHSLIVVGGSNMNTGKFEDVEILSTRPATLTQSHAADKQATVGQLE